MYSLYTSFLRPFELQSRGLRTHTFVSLSGLHNTEMAIQI